MRYLSVCSGIEAASVAWEPLGWEPAGFSEIDPFASSLLSRRFPAVPNFGDLNEHEKWPIDVGAIDVLVGGTPCQSFSLAGLRKGLSDPRGNLALVYLRLADRIRPRWIVWENVPGVLSSGRGRDFGSFLGALGELGYGFAFRVLDAQYVRVDGFPRAVPQRRRRVFVVGYSGGWQRAAEILFEREGVRGNPPTRRSPGEGASTESGNGPASGGGKGWPVEVAPTLDATWRDRSPHGMDQEWASKRGGLFVPGVPEICGTLSDGAHHGGGLNGQDAYSGRILPVTFKPSHYTRGKDGAPSQVSPPLSADADKGDQEALLLATLGVRRLTPRECERLQGFPDDWTAVPHRGKPAADGNRYRALGNSMAVNVIRWIGRRIEAAEKGDPLR